VLGRVDTHLALDAIETFNEFLPRSPAFAATGIDWLFDKSQFLASHHLLPANELLGGATTGISATNELGAADFLLDVDQLESLASLDAGCWSWLATATILGGSRHRKRNCKANNCCKNILEHLEPLHIDQFAAKCCLEKYPLACCGRLQRAKKRKSVNIGLADAVSIGTSRTTGKAPMMDSLQDGDTISCFAKKTYGNA